MPAREFCQQISGFLDLTRDEVEDVVEDMALVGDLQLSTLAGTEVLYFYGYYRTECQVAGKIAKNGGKHPKARRSQYQRSHIKGRKPERHKTHTEPARGC